MSVGNARSGPPDLRAYADGIYAPEAGIEPGLALLARCGIGRTDLRGGSMGELLQSVKSHVFTLPRNARIWPGHGPSTTVGAEKTSNPFLRSLGGGA